MVKHQSKKEESSSQCAMNTSSCIRDGMKIFGDSWTLFIVDALGHGDKRFCEIQRVLGGLNPVTLTNRLKKLEQLKFIERREEVEDKVSVTYSLTDKGKGMLPILHEIRLFAQKFLH